MHKKTKVEAACESAKQNPAEDNTFRQLRLNQWVKQSVRWMPMHLWDKCSFAVNPDALEGRPCYGGLNLSSTTDITAFVLVFPPTEDDDKYYVLPYFWIPEDSLELRVRRDHVPYDVWERQGFLKTTEGKARLSATIRLHSPSFRCCNRAQTQSRGQDPSAGLKLCRGGERYQ